MQTIPAAILVHIRNQSPRAPPVPQESVEASGHTDMYGENTHSVWKHWVMSKNREEEAGTGVGGGRHIDLWLFWKI